MKTQRSVSGVQPQVSETPTVVDLFCGAGGMAEGFEQAGYRCLCAFDSDAQAVETFKFNHPAVAVFQRDIAALEPLEVLEVADAVPGELDVLCGGPPCQGFSLAGPRLADDPRNELFKHFVALARALQPRAVVFENVPGLISMQQGAVLKAIRQSFVDIGYRTNDEVLNTADYGVPQSRPRFFLIAVRDGLDKITFPPPAYEMPSRDRQTSFFPSLRPHLTVWDGLSDLPHIGQGEGSEEMLHVSEPKNEYQAERRGHRNPGVIYNHRATRHSAQIQERYAAIPEGADNGVLPLEVRTKKINVFKLHRNQPSRTVTCNHRTDLLHPVIPRGTTVREAARLQSFDDDYRFFGNLTRKAKWVTQDDQVGNAVPPLMARAIAAHLNATVLRRDEKEQRQRENRQREERLGFVRGTPIGAGDR